MTENYIVVYYSFSNNPIMVILPGKDYSSEIEVLDELNIEPAVCKKTILSYDAIQQDYVNQLIGMLQVLDE